jgi:Leucine-rich repeat (LRR) protein
LDLSYNSIEELAQLASLCNLETIDFTGNQISDWSQIESLVKCLELIELQLKENPIMNFKTHVDISIALPNLKVIDDVCFIFNLNL